MATSKVKSTPKKVADTVKEEVVKEVSKKRAFAQDDYIMCRSVTVGDLWYDGPKSHTTHNWVDYGDENEVEYRDLAASVRSRSKYIFGPLFVIEDEDFVNEFPQLKKFYEEQYTVDDLKSVLDLSVNDMIATLQTLPQSAVNSLKSIASTMIVNGQLDSVKKIKALDDFFGTELNLLSSIAD